MSWEVRLADCVEAMAAMDEASVDAVVCDPPYGLEFMGKEWDRLGGTVEDCSREADPFSEQRGGSLPFGGGGQRVRYGASAQTMQAWHQAWAEAALRVLKPGGHLLAFGGTRTYHRLACAVEDAGFEIRDTICWLYGSGFPKSLDVSKAIDRAAGAEREVVGQRDRYRDGCERQNLGERGLWRQANGVADVTAPATPEAAEWEGWGTALKPAHEPVVVARKPLAGTVSQNVLRYGTGGLNVDGCRVEGPPRTTHADGNHQGTAPHPMSWGEANGYATHGAAGRWPANVVLDERAAAMLGAPSRFLYVAKAGRAERNAGLDGMPARTRNRVNPGGLEHDPKWAPTQVQNHHPTVKPVALMRWLVRLVTPPGGTVLDPFTGSGTTGIAAVVEDFNFIGFERESEYAEIARVRIAHWAARPHQLSLEEAA